MPILLCFLKNHLLFLLLHGSWLIYCVDIIHSIHLEVTTMRLCMRLLIPCVTLLALLGCASTPAPQPNRREVEMLAEIQKKRGERSSLIASRLLQQIKAVEMKSGKRAAYDYLVRTGYRWPYEAVTILKTLFP